MDKTQKLLHAISLQAIALVALAGEMSDSYGNAYHSYSELAADFAPLAKDPTPGFELFMNSASDNIQWFLDDLKDFDKQLTLIIKLRNQLAEETGVSVYNAINT